MAETNFTDTFDKKTKQLSLLIIVNIALMAINLGMIFVSSSRIADLKDSTGIEKTGTGTEVSLPALAGQVKILEKQLATLANNIVPPDTMSKDFNEKISSSIQLITSKISQLREEVKKSQTLVQSLEKK